MKKIISGLVVFALIATPCLAEIKPESLFSLNGTGWNTCYLIGIPPVVVPGCKGRGMAFYEGKVYSCSDVSEPGYCDASEPWYSSYIDLGVVSIVFGVYPFLYDLAILQPIGLGYYTSAGCFCWIGLCGCYSLNGIMYKVTDNWSPYDEDVDDDGIDIKKTTVMVILTLTKLTRIMTE